MRIIWSCSDTEAVEVAGSRVAMVYPEFVGSGASPTIDFNYQVMFYNYNALNVCIEWVDSL